MQKKFLPYIESRNFFYWDSRARTYTLLIQSQAPYQFGHIPVRTENIITLVFLFFK